MKKLTVLLICAFLIGAMALPAAAADVTRMTITSGAVSAAPGDEITFEVEISGDTACTALGLMLEYDSEVFELVDGKCMLSGALIKLFDQERGFAYLYSKETVPSGVMGTFTLKVKSGAPDGEASVSGKASVQNGSGSISSAVVGATVTVSGGNSEGSSGSNTGAAETVAPEKPEETAPAQDRPAADAAKPENEGKQTEEPETTEPEQIMTMETAAPEEELATEAAPSEQPTEPELPTQEQTGNGVVILCLVMAAVFLVALVVLLVLKKKRTKSE